LFKLTQHMKNSNEIFNNMTKGEWSFSNKGNAIISSEWGIEPDEKNGEEGINVQIISTFAAMGGNHPNVDIEAIVNAVNGTYGKGIDPVCVGEILEALKQLYDATKTFSVLHGQTKIMQLSKSVIEKATLTHSLTSKTV